VNLVHNAIEALGGSANGLIEVSAVPVDRNLAEVIVRDNGPGLGEAIKARLFEPFVTSKATGMGVGLSICRSIVEDHGGRLIMEENDTGGVTFRFTLPVSSGKIAP
jgi:two-component system sensor kinase FixL